MKIISSRDAQMMRRASLGPAAIAERARQFRHLNVGLPQRRFIDGDMMRRGGSMGDLGNIHDDGDYTLLGCCGLGAVAVPSVVKVGPIAARMIQLRKAGSTPQAALLEAMATLAKQGVKTVTPDIHLQLAAGLQKLPSGLSGFLGALGLAPIAKTAVTSGSIAASSVGVGAATALGIGSGIALGQTVIPIPVVGAVIGAIVFEAAHLMQRHVGKAEAAWANQGFYNSLRQMNGRDYDEKQFSEAFKGMMDTGNNIIPGCGPDRHKNPDCLLGPLAGVIAQGYLTQRVPLSATTAQVFQTVVIPWLQSGVGGLVNWRVLAAEPIQLLMLQAATDRYLAGQAMTRGDMPAYAGQGGAHTPTLVQALQPILQQPTTTTPQVAGVTAPIPAKATQQIPYPVPAGGGGINPALLPPSVPYISPYAGGSSSYVPSAGGAPAIGYPSSALPAPLPALPSPAPGLVTAGGVSGLPTWLTIGAAVIALGFALARPATRGEPHKEIAK